MYISTDTIFFEDMCPHDHTYHCLQCYQLEETLTAVTKMTADMEWDNPEAYLFKVCDPYLSIQCRDKFVQNMK